MRVGEVASQRAEQARRDGGSKPALPGARRCTQAHARGRATMREQNAAVRRAVAAPRTGRLCWAFRRSPRGSGDRSRRPPAPRPRLRGVRRAAPRGNVGRRATREAAHRRQRDPARRAAARRRRAAAGLRGDASRPVPLQHARADARALRHAAQRIRPRPHAGRRLPRTLALHRHGEVRAHVCELLQPVEGGARSAVRGRRPRALPLRLARRAHGGDARFLR